jgi:hypothetical protein
MGGGQLPRLSGRSAGVLSQPFFRQSKCVRVVLSRCGGGAVSFDMLDTRCIKVVSGSRSPLLPPAVRQATHQPTVRQFDPEHPRRRLGVENSAGCTKLQPRRPHLDTLRDICFGQLWAFLFPVRPTHQPATATRSDLEVP